MVNVLFLILLISFGMFHDFSFIYNLKGANIRFIYNLKGANIRSILVIWYHIVQNNDKILI